MTVEKWLKHATDKLERIGIGSARLDALILLEDSLNKDRAWLLAHPEARISVVKLRRLERQLVKRVKHEPLAYIRGHTEFYGRKFKINRHVLEPRPESETMIDLLKQIAGRQKSVVGSRKGSWLEDRGSRLNIADVGTGCGAIGITAKLEIPGARVDLYDVSAGALAVARANEHIHELKLHIRKMNLLARPLVPYDIVLANLPYVPSGWKINEAAMAEPKLAIFGGKDGLDLYRRLFAQLERFTADASVGAPTLWRRGWKPKYLLTESLPPQHQKLAKIAAGHRYKLLKSQDFIQVFEII